MKKTLTLLLTFTLVSSFSQTNVRGWYADGQVWIVWEESGAAPETYAIYADPVAFSSTNDATLIGRLFPEEWKPGAMRQQIDSSSTYRIPDGAGGLYQLADNEGLFVATPHQAGALWVAVVKWGDTAVFAGDNITDAAVPFAYNPAADPVECHFQGAWISSPGYATLIFYMWSDGRQNHWEGRPDFPITANQAKNGMPYFFLVSGPTDIDTTQAIPATIWLHGGGGTAIQSLPDGRPIINLFPEEGLLVAHNDDLFGYILSTYPSFETVSWHFGWRKNYDPFSTSNLPTALDTVINYTQRRYIWIDQWLERRFNVDPNRININGHSMGSAGTTALAKAYPDHYASASIFNNGFGGPEDSSYVAAVLWGPTWENFPTNLVNPAGETVHVGELFNLTDRISPLRDLPLMRSWHGKNDNNGTMRWDAYVVEQYRAADSMGFGMQLMWSERDHGIDTGPALGDHWAHGNLPTQQTILEDVAYEEANFRSDVSFPAFFNHRLDPNAGDPGDGTQGTDGSGVGDDWGAWGGYHRWDWNDIIDEPDVWEVSAWLESNAVFANDNCPVEQLTADMYIRKPRQFKPFGDLGTLVAWNVTDEGNGEELQSGVVGVLLADTAVVIPEVVVYREGIRRVRIKVWGPVGSVKSILEQQFEMTLLPNPSRGEATLRIYSKKEMNALIRVHSLDGQCYLTQETRLMEKENRVALKGLETLPAGMYVVEVMSEGQVRTVKLAKY